MSERAANMADVTGNLGSAPDAVLWASQSVWSQAANALKLGIGRARAFALGLTVAAAVLATLATQIVALSSAAGKALSLAAAVAVGLAPIARSRLAPASVAEWTRVRSVAEALKSELFIFWSGTGPYSGRDRDHQLDLRTRQVIVDGDDLLRYTVGLRPMPRPLPSVTDVDTYRQARLAPQLQWYRERASDLSRKLSRVRYAQLLLSVFGVLLASVAAIFNLGAAAEWVAVVTTIIAAVTAYAAASRYEYQLVEYLRTAAQLERLQSAWATGAKDAKAGEALVLECEQVVSVQNEAWMAKWIAGSDAAATGVD